MESMATRYYALFFLIKQFGDEQTELKIELINDIAFHYSEMIRDPVIGAVDRWRNILSNKLSAVFRHHRFCAMRRASICPHGPLCSRFCLKK